LYCPRMPDTVGPRIDIVKEINMDTRARVAYAIERVKQDRSLNNTSLAEVVGVGPDLIGLLLKKERPASRLFLTAFKAKFNLRNHYFTGESEQLYSHTGMGYKTELIVELGIMLKDNHLETIKNTLNYVKSMNNARAAERQP